MAVKIRGAAAAILSSLLLAAILMATTAAAAAEQRSIAFLGVVFQNDNAAYEPTTAAEKARIAALEQQFIKELADTGRFAFVPVGGDIRKAIDAGPELGACAGCESEFGRKVGAGEVAWIKVQKVSNLILNMTVHMVDVTTEKPVFMHSVDIRGNTDEMWSRSLTFLIKYYLKPSFEKVATGPGL